MDPRVEFAVPAAPDYERVLAGTSSAQARFDEERVPFNRRLRLFIHRNPTFVPFIILLISILAFSIINGWRFLSLFNLSLIMQQVTIIAAVAIAQTFIVLTAGIDLSVGSILVISQIVMAHLAVLSGLPLGAALLVGFAVGTSCGLINGILVTKFRLPPFIATLGTWSIFNALNIWYSHGETIDSGDIATAAPLLQLLGTTFKLHGASLTFGFLMLAVVAFISWFLLNETALGRHIYATGDDAEASRLAGINTTRTLIAVYTIAGLICGIGGWMLIGRIGAASPLAGGTLNLDSITAVVIGGTSLFGGRGSIVGSLTGALIVGVFRNGLALGGVDVVWQEFSVGCLILSAVAIDQWIRRVAK